MASNTITVYPGRIDEFHKGKRILEETYLAFGLTAGLRR